MTDKLCKNCIYFNKDALASQCRRYPQYVNREPADFCGEFKDKPKVKAPVKPKTPAKTVRYGQNV